MVKINKCNVIIALNEKKTILMEDLKEIYYQTANRKNIEEIYGETQWVQISDHEELNGADTTYWCVVRTGNSGEDKVSDSDFELIGDEYGK